MWTSKGSSACPAQVVLDLPQVRREQQDHDELVLKCGVPFLGKSSRARGHQGLDLVDGVSAHGGIGRALPAQTPLACCGDPVTFIPSPWEGLTMSPRAGGSPAGWLFLAAYELSFPWGYPQ